MHRGSLCLTMYPGDLLAIGTTIVKFEHKAGKQIRIHIAAPKDVPIIRNPEVNGSARRDKIQDESAGKTEAATPPGVVHKNPAGDEAG